MKTAKQVLEQAQELARTTESWADFSNALFAMDGVITRAYPARAEREAFLKTETYRKIRALFAEAVETHGLVAGATPKKSG